MSEEVSAQFVDDFQYFIFTKSTKSLLSIKALLKNDMMEDALIILRSMFEGYLASRYIDEKYDQRLINDFLFIPELIMQRKIIYNGKIVMDRGKNEIDFIQHEPSEMKLEKRDGYFYDFYDYLCKYTHNNYSVLPCYIVKNSVFTCVGKTNPLLTRVMVLFVYTKIFESIVTVEGEDFLDTRTEKACYKLVEEVTEFLNNMLDYYSHYNSTVNKKLNKHMKDMFKGMKKSLEEEVGSVKKDFLPKTSKSN